MKKTILWSAVALLVMVSAIVIAEVVLIGKYKRILESQVAAIRAAGEPLSATDLYPSECLPGKNGVPGLIQFFELIGTRDSRGVWDEDSQLNGLIHAVHNSIDENQIRIAPYEREALPQSQKALLAFMSKHAESIDIFSAALESPCFDYKNDYHKMYDMRIPQCSMAKFSCKLFAAASVAAFQANEPETALEYWRISMRANEALRDEKYVMAVMTRNFIIHTSLFALESLLQSREWTVEHLEVMSNALPADELLPNLRSALQAERTWILSILNPNDEERKAFQTQFMNAKEARFHFGTHLYRKDISIALDMYRRILKEYAEDPPHVWLEKSWWDEECEAISTGNSISLSLMPTTDEYARDCIKNQTNLRMMKLALRLHIDKLSGTPYPVELSTGAGDSTLVDPFSGGPFQYEKRGNGFTLKSAASEESWIRKGSTAFYLLFQLTLDK